MARLTAAERRRARQTRNNDPAAVERAKNFVYTDCWICENTFVLNNNLTQKVDKRGSEYRGRMLCAHCRPRWNGRVLRQNDWAKQFVDMHAMLTDIAEGNLKPKKLKKLLDEINSQRPRRRLYRKKSRATEV